MVTACAPRVGLRWHALDNRRYVSMCQPGCGCSYPDSDMQVRMRGRGGRGVGCGAWGEGRGVGTGWARRKLWGLANAGCRRGLGACGLGLGALPCRIIGTPSRRSRQTGRLAASLPLPCPTSALPHLDPAPPCCPQLLHVAQVVKQHKRDWWRREGQAYADARERSCGPQQWRDWVLVHFPCQVG